MDFVFSEINGDKKRRGFVSMHIMDILLICFTSWYVATSNRLKCTCSHFMHVLYIYMFVYACVNKICMNPMNNIFYRDMVWDFARHIHISSGFKCECIIHCNLCNICYIMTLA